MGYLKSTMKLMAENSFVDPDPFVSYSQRMFWHMHCNIGYLIIILYNFFKLASIINRSSIDGQIAEPGLFAYCASKGAVTILTKSAALCCGEKGYKIRVNSVHPGYIHTALTEEEARGYGLEPEEYFKKVGKQHPLGCIGEPDDIAFIDVYLASDESKWTTGAEFVVDGGWTAQ